MTVTKEQREDYAQMLHDACNSARELIACTPIKGEWADRVVRELRVAMTVSDRQRFGIWHCWACGGPLNESDVDEEDICRYCGKRSCP